MNKYKEDANTKTKQIISSNFYMTISVATLTSEPWIANLYFVTDSKHSFYWYSPRESRHSVLINQNSKIAISIFDSNAAVEDVDAVYVKAQAREIKDNKELLRAMKLYGEKMLRTKFVKDEQEMKSFIDRPEDFLGDSPLRFYIAIPEKIWKLGSSKDLSGKYLIGRDEVKLN